MQLWIGLLVAFSLSIAGCWLITKSSKLSNIGNVAPTEDRWHQQATPGLGGIPIYIAFALTAISICAWVPVVSAVLASTLLLVVLGTYDDIKFVSPKPKLAAQLLSSLLFFTLLALNNEGTDAITYAVAQPVLAIAEGHLLSMAHVFICVVWIIGIINAINLLDNMDGLSGGIAFIACITVAFLTNHSIDAGAVSLMYYILGASLAGFLVLNRHPAKLFMGDAGSLWIGFVVATGAIVVASVYFKASMQSSPNSHSSLPAPLTYSGSHAILLYVRGWLLAVVICTVPICDTLMVMITRRLRQQPVSVGGKDHLSHRLVCIGFSQTTSVAILYLVAGIASLLACLIYFQPATVWLGPLCAFIAAVSAGIGWLTNTTSAPAGVAVRKNKTQQYE